ncbi:MAG TPA: trigger factor [Chlamydiales bacterium]|nr:trigger factor [Chlamydiales bacterium]
MSQGATAQPTEIAGKQVRVLVYRKPACLIELNVKAAAEIVKQARKEAIKGVNKEVTLPGFRKGKAPDEMILKKYPADVERQLHKSIADVAFQEAQKIANVPVLNNNSSISFDLKKISDEGAELVFAFETEPKVPSVDGKLFVPKPVERAEVAEKQIEEAVRQMMFFYAQWKLVEDRPIQEGDYIMIDLDTVEGETVQRVFNHIRFEVSGQRMANWMKLLVIGAKSGAILEGMSEVDETATEEERREFKPKKVRLHILKVEEAVLPELNDEFAKKVGAANVAHMRQSIADLLNKQADEKARNDLREQVNEFLIAEYAFELPKSLIETEKKHRQAQLMQDPKFKANWNRMSQEERKNIEEKIENESAQAVRLFYLSRQVVHDAKIPVTHKEVQDEAIATLQSYGSRNVEIDRIPKEIYALALSKVILAKSQENILQKQKA